MRSKLNASTSAIVYKLYAKLIDILKMHVLHTVSHTLLCTILIDNWDNQQSIGEDGSSRQNHSVVYGTQKSQRWSKTVEWYV